MIVTVKEIVESDSFDTQHGQLYGWKFIAQDEAGNDHWLGINTKAADGLAVGKTFEFLPTGKSVGKWTLGKRAQNSPANAHRAPQSASGGGQSPQPARPAAPTMSQAVAVLKECIDAVKPFGGSDAHATTLFLARLRGDIRRDPTSAEIEAQKAEAARKAEEAAKEAERLAAEAAKAQALAAMGPAPDDGDDLIPF